MKRAFLLILVLMMLVSLCACGGDAVTPTTQPIETSCPHNFSAATCTEGSSCNLCGVAGEEALGHDRVDGTCQRCGHSLGELDPLWPGVWCVVSLNGTEMTRVDFVFGDGEGNVGTSTWSTTYNDMGDFFYYNDTEYYSNGNGAFAMFTSVGDEYNMTITITTEDGATGTVTIERIEARRFKVTAVSGTILDQTATAIVTVGSELLLTDMYC